MTTSIKAKVYLIYLKKTGELYAYTQRKDYKDRFLQERNEKKFVVKKVKMDERDWQIFSANQYDKMLWEYPLNISLTDYVTIMSTAEEDNEVVTATGYIEHMMEDLYRTLCKETHLKKKYKKAIKRLCTTSKIIVNKKGEKENVSTMDIFHVFYELFNDTFT